jgi:hypothetical protein
VRVMGVSLTVVDSWFSLTVLGSWFSVHRLRVTVHGRHRT